MFFVILEAKKDQLKKSKMCFTYRSVLSKWEFFIKMRAACLLSPSFITQGRMGAREAALILMKNSHFDRTPQYVLCINHYGWESCRVFDNFPCAKSFLFVQPSTFRSSRSVRTNLSSGTLCEDTLGTNQSRGSMRRHSSNKVPKGDACAHLKWRSHTNSYH